MRRPGSDPPGAPLPEAGAHGAGRSAARCGSRHGASWGCESTRPATGMRLGRSCGWARNGESRYVCVATVNNVIEAYDDPDYGAVMEAADLVTPDGMPLVWGLRLLGVGAATRVYGPDLTPIGLPARRRPRRPRRPLRWQPGRSGSAHRQAGAAVSGTEARRTAPARPFGRSPRTRSAARSKTWNGPVPASCS